MYWFYCFFFFTYVDCFSTLKKSIDFGFSFTFYSFESICLLDCIRIVWKWASFTFLPLMSNMLHNFWSEYLRDRGEWIKGQGRTILVNRTCFLCLSLHGRLLLPLNILDGLPVREFFFSFICISGLRHVFHVTR